MDNKNNSTLELRHIVWVNTYASFRGGVENYIHQTALLLESQGIKSTLIFSVNDPADPHFTGAFSQAYPAVEISRQLASLKPDLILVNQWPADSTLEHILAFDRPVLRYIHDSEIFRSSETQLTTAGRRESMAPASYKFYHPLIAKSQHLRNCFHYQCDLKGWGNKNRRLSMQADKLLVASEYMLQQLQNHGVPSDKIEVIPLFVPVPTELPSVKRDDDHLLFVGQLIRGKGLDLLLHAMTKLDKIPKLTVCGEGKQQAELQELCTHLKLDHKVNFRGYVTRQELTTYYQKASCVVVPSRVPETFCLVGPEAMAQGAAVIATSLGGMPSWQQDGAVLTCKENNVESLKTALNKVLYDKNLSQEMGVKGHKLCHQKFSPEVHLKNLLAVLKPFSGAVNND